MKTILISAALAATMATRVQAQDTAQDYSQLADTYQYLAECQYLGIPNVTEVNVWDVADQLGRMRERMKENGWSNDDLNAIEIAHDDHIQWVVKTDWSENHGRAILACGELVRIAESSGWLTTRMLDEGASQ